MNIGVAALQTWIVSTQQHIFQTEILAHLVIQAWLHAFKSSLLLFSKSSLAPPGP